MSRLWLPDDTPAERVFAPLFLVAGAVLSLLARGVFAARRRWGR